MRLLPNKDSFICILFFIIISLIWHSYDITVGAGIAVSIVYLIIAEKFTTKNKHTN